MNPIFVRTQRLLGTDALDRLAAVRVILFGTGGVGSWCAEALVRTGIAQLTIVDSDCVQPSNINRQLMATSRTVGMYKVDVLRERLLEINPDARITAIKERFTEESAASFQLEQYDYILDCIDSLKDKAALILRATATPATCFSSMGAACKIDPTRIRVADFWEVRGCPLGAALRKRLRKNGTLPAKPFRCVYSEEVLPNLGPADDGNAVPVIAGPADIPASGDNGVAVSIPAAPNGSLVHITGIFGFTLAGLVLEDIVRPGAER